MARMGVVGIVIEGDRSVAGEVQNILHDFGDIIVGRMGIPDKIKQIYLISLIVNGTVEQISALTGKLGRINSVTVKSALTTLEV